jgi:hypothetical protein
MALTILIRMQTDPSIPVSEGYGGAIGELHQPEIVTGNAILFSGAGFLN